VRNGRQSFLRFQERFRGSKIVQIVLKLHYLN
jgi:hypothetical protein